MSIQLPPLRALRAFIVVARTLSFSKAARELHVTPAAVTHQIKLLEDLLGVQLLHRTKRSVALTAAGSAALPDLEAGFQRLTEGIAKLAPQKGRDRISITVAPSFAASWLVPRLEAFSLMHPQIDVQISATPELVDFRDGRTDIAIRFGRGNYPGLSVELLAHETMTPLCAPSLHEELPLRRPQDLERHRLIHDISIPSGPNSPDWRAWLEKAGVTGVDSTQGIRFTLAELALQSAVDRCGVVLGRVTLARRYIRLGILKAPFDLEMATDFSYYIITPQSTSTRPAVAEFCEWLRTQALKDRNEARKTPAEAA